MRALIAILLCIPLLGQACEPPRDANGRIQRSKKVKDDFKATFPCPATGELSKKCPGYVIDHIVPLACCGADSVENMQWQTRAEAKAKDRWERKKCGAAD
jgi:hypothetical protein